MSHAISLEELASSAGLTRRAVRFYIQRKLLPPPLGAGRGKHYDESHLERLRKLIDLQTAGYSLDDIGRLLDGQVVEAPTGTARRRVRSAGAVELWSRIKVAEGLELHVDMNRFPLDAQQLLEARERLRSMWRLNQGATTESDGDMTDRATT